MDKKLRILSLEDDPADFDLACSMLEAEGLKFSAERVVSPEDYYTAIASGEYDLTLADHTLPQFTAIEALKYVAAHAPRHPVILVTGTIGEEAAVEAMRLGARDYVLKDKLYRLPPVVTRTLQELERENELLLLEQSEKERQMLAQSLETLDQVLGVVSHELRTPLAGVRASVELLLQQELQDPHRTVLVAAKNEIVNLVEVVNDLLDAVRMNKGVVSWNWGEVCLDEVCREAIEAIRPTTQANVGLEFSCTPTALRMVGDSAAIRRMLVNLLANANRHTTEGLIEIVVSETRDGRHGFVVIEVRDTGSGISAVKQKSLGKAFSLAGEKKGDVIGVGLGLSISCAIAAAHGGWIACRSEVGEGTTMKVSLRADLSEPLVLDSGQSEQLIIRSFEEEKSS